ncbi:MAG: hypothetical protein ACOY33_02965 [Pseudomonadota bacterium]
MRPDRLTVNLRPRSGFEAVDLGFALARRHARELWRIWLLLVLPAMILLALAEHALFGVLPSTTCMLLWWGKPLYDAVVLLVLSRAVFGDRLSARGTLAELRRVAGRIAGSLTLRRLSLSRSFLLPAHLLEGQHGKARSDRIHLLREETTASARTLTMASGWLEVAALSGLLALLVWLTPELYRSQWFNDFLQPVGHLELLGWQLAYIAAVTLIEPFYVAAGFALYLNRRTLLEAWDIEVALKRVAARLPQSAGVPD